jgi:nicotinate-nucleotide adenylyltransferase
VALTRSELLTAGLKVGLLGGSFNPAHEGHLYITRMFLRALQLDYVWWIISPQNPLKSEVSMNQLSERFTGACEFVKRSGNKCIVVTDIENQLGTRYTIDTVRELKIRYPTTCFVWLMGADNMIQLTRWMKWHRLIQEIPFAVYPRLHFNLKSRLCLAATTMKSMTISVKDAALIASLSPPVLVFLEGREHIASATEIRKVKSILRT